VSRAQELLDAATPLPWRHADESRSFYRLSGTFITPVHPADPNDPLMVAYTGHGGDVSQPDAALIVYSVNRLPAYEELREKLERIKKAYFDSNRMSGGENDYQLDRAMWDAKTVLAALRDEVPA
jgi:hypothetical protein